MNYKLKYNKYKTKYINLLKQHGGTRTLLDDINKDNKISGITSLMQAVIDGNQETCIMLILNGADINETTDNGYNALSFAIENNNIEIVNILLAEHFRLLENNKESNIMNCIINKRLTPLMLGIKKGYIEICALLIRNSKLDDLNNTVKGITPFMYALKQKQKEICDLLIESHVFIYGITVNNKTTMMYAAQNGYIDICKLLISRYDMEETQNFFRNKEYIITRDNQFKYASFLNQKDSYGITALMSASYAGHLDICNFLIKCGSDVNLTNQAETSALMLASNEGYFEICNLLITNGANINLTNQCGNTALMYASKIRHLDICNLLIKYGADVNLRNKAGTTALMFALKAGHLEMSNLLIKHGAIFNRKQ